MIQIPKVGIAAFIYDPEDGGRILMGKRKGSHGEGTWGLVGGHIDFMEMAQACIIREAREETNLEIIPPSIERLGWGESFYPTGINSPHHGITVFVRARVYNPSALKLMEPSKCEAWEWFNPRALPRPLFAALETYLDNGGTP